MTGFSVSKASFAVHLRWWFLHYIYIYIYIYTHATVFCCKIWIGPMGQVKRQQEIAQANTAAAKECLCFLRVQNTQIEAGILLRPWYFRTIYIGNQDLFDHSKMSKWAMKKTPWLLGYYIGDDILSSYEGIRIQQTIIRTPIKQPHSMESEVVLFPETVPGSRDTLRCGKRVPGTLSLEKKHGGITNFWIPIITILSNYIFIKSSRYLFGT